MRKLALIGLAAAAMVVGWRVVRSDGDDAKLVFDRFWVDHEARGTHDQFEAFVLNGEHPVGHFGTRTPWKGQWEGFHYHVVPRHDGDFDLFFPASDQRERVNLRARRCDEQGFDYCLEVSGASRGVPRYLSRRGWEWSGGPPPAQLSELLSSAP
jgi:hypothetical protein